MSNIVVVDSKTLSEILTRLDRLTKDVADVKERLFSTEPVYGNDEWWKWSDKKAREEIKKGSYYKVHNKKELRDFLKNIHSTSSNERYYNKVQR